MQDEKIYQDGDMLSLREVLPILEKNSGHKINDSYPPHLIRSGRIKGWRKVGRKYKYPYSEIKDIIISKENSGYAAKPDNEVTPGALRTRQSRQAMRELIASGRLELPDYQDDDELSSREAALVISRNAGRFIDPGNMAKFVARGSIPASKLGSDKMNVFRYGDIKDFVPGARPGRRSAQDQDATKIV